MTTYRSRNGRANTIATRLTTQSVNPLHTLGNRRNGLAKFPLPELDFVRVLVEDHDYLVVAELYFQLRDVRLTDDVRASLREGDLVAVERKLTVFPLVYAGQR